MKNRFYILVVIFVLLLGGCASVPMANVERDNIAKTFKTQSDSANIYVYRNETFSPALRMALTILSISD